MTISQYHNITTSQYQVKLELRSISEEERVKSGLARAKLGGLSKAEIMEMVIIIIITRTLREKTF